MISGTCFEAREILSLSVGPSVLLQNLVPMLFPLLLILKVSEKLVARHPSRMEGLARISPAQEKTGKNTESRHGMMALTFGRVVPSLRGLNISLAVFRRLLTR